MTEQQWLASNQPHAMLDFLQGKASDRKLRLFAVACCRRIWHLLPNMIGRHAIDVAERIAEGSPIQENLVELLDGLYSRSFAYIDGYKTERDANIGYHSLRATYNALPDVLPPHRFSAYPALRPNILEVASDVAFTVANASRRCDERDADKADFQRELDGQVPLLQDIFGNPFRPIALDLSWVTSTVQRLAAAIYEERAFDRMPILGDALEEAGCTNADILNHCRKPGEHVRGCWVVDLLLAKE